MLGQGPPVKGADHGKKPPLKEFQDPGVFDLVADVDALSAEDAVVGV